MSQPQPAQRGPHPDVGPLVAAATAGDERAWSDLIHRFEPVVLGVARGYRIDERDAQDVAQVVWLRLWENLAAIREPRAVPGWIVTTARHECARVIRGLRRLVPLGDAAAETPADHPDPEDGLLRAEIAAAIRRGLAELTPVQRSLLELLAAEPDLSYREIGGRLHMPVGSIGPTRARGLARLGGTQSVLGLAAG
jgi:RNA polymerase sigma factor (sigma-70 family)